MNAKKGDWVRIHKILLTPEERASRIPEDTRKVPLEMWDKGFLVNDNASPGDEVEIETIIGRRITGCLLEKNPRFSHSWGFCIPETLHIGRQVKQILAEREAAGE